MKLFLNKNVSVFFDKINKKYLLSNKLLYLEIYTEKNQVFEKLIKKLKKSGVDYPEKDSGETKFLNQLKKVPGFIIYNRIFTEQRQSKNIDYLYSNFGNAGNYKKIADKKICLMGVGSLGSNILIQLAALGFKSFVLCDGDIVSESNLNRQVIFSSFDIEKPKAKIVEKWLKKFDKDIHVTTFINYFKKTSDFSILPNDIDLLILSADEPYKKIVEMCSEYCNKEKIKWVRINRDGFGPLKVFENKGSCANCKQLNEEKIIQNLLSNRKINMSPGCIIPDIYLITSLFVKQIFRFYIFDSSDLNNTFLNISYKNALYPTLIKNKIRRNRDCSCN